MAEAAWEVVKAEAGWEGVKAEAACGAGCAVALAREWEEASTVLGVGAEVRGLAAEEIEEEDVSEEDPRVEDVRLVRRDGFEREVSPVDDVRREGLDRLDLTKRIDVSPPRKRKKDVRGKGKSSREVPADPSPPVRLEPPLRSDDEVNGEVVFPTFVD